MQQSFRPQRSTIYFLLAGVAFSFVLLTGSIFIYLNDGSGSKTRAAIMCLAVFGFMLSVSLYTLAYYFVERVTFRGTHVTIRTLFGTRDVDLDQLDSLSWRYPPIHGAIHVLAVDKRTKLSLHGYAKSDRLQIIRILRDLAPFEKQFGWPEFCHHVALPLRDGAAYGDRDGPASRKFTITRRRYHRAALIGVPLTLVVVLPVAIGLDVWLRLFLPIAVFGCWLLVRFIIPPAGEVHVHNGTVESFASFVAYLLVAAALIANPLRLDQPALFVTGLTVMGAAWVAMLILNARSDRRRGGEDACAATDAPRIWHSGESTTI